MADILDRFSYSPGCAERSLEALETAFERVPFYRDNWKKYDVGAGASVDERFAALPLLTKADMRAAFPGGLIRDDLSLDEGLRGDDIEYTFTSGTTGEKVVNIWNQKWWHASEMSSWKLNPALRALSYPPRQATLASSLNVGIHCEEDLPMSHRTMGNLLYLNEKINILCWKEFHLKRMADELNSYRPTVLEANPFLLARLCYWAIDNGVSLYSPSVITFTYELPSAMHLAAIRRVFSSALVSSYGTTETGFVMDTCEMGLYHQNSDSCRIDFIPLRPEFGGPELGRLAVTTFGNPWSCIVRFDVGDIVKLHSEGSCACGIGEGLIADSVEGRVTNSTFTVDGGLITTAAADRALSDIPGIREYDLVQLTRDSYDLTIVVHGNEKSAQDAAWEKMENLYGARGKFSISCARDLFPGPSGKYRRTHAEFAFDEGALTEK